MDNMLAILKKLGKYLAVSGWYSNILKKNRSKKLPRKGVLSISVWILKFSETERLGLAAVKLNISSYQKSSKLMLYNLNNDPIKKIVNNIERLSKLLFFIVSLVNNYNALSSLDKDANIP